jgi:hypothetical protein
MRRTVAELFIVWLAICSALKTGDEQIEMRLPPPDQSLADFARGAHARPFGKLVGFILLVCSA